MWPGPGFPGDRRKLTLWSDWGGDIEAAMEALRKSGLALLRLASPAAEAGTASLQLLLRPKTLLA